MLRSCRGHHLRRPAHFARARREQNLLAHLFCVAMPEVLQRDLAALAGGLSAVLLKLLEPAVNGLFVQQGAAIRLWDAAAS